MWILFTGENLRFKSSYLFLKRSLIYSRALRVRDVQILFGVNTLFKVLGEILLDVLLHWQLTEKRNLFSTPGSILFRL